MYVPKRLVLISVIAILAASWQLVINSIVGLELSCIMTCGSQCLLHLLWCSLLVVINQREHTVLPMETKWIEIVPIDNKMQGGEYIDDTESTANIICYAMGVHSSLIGATPGKSSSTLGGTQARELYLMKQACMKPIVDRVMRPLRVIKAFNKWDKDIYINVPEYIFTTLDQNKSGKQESTNTEA